MAKSAAHPLFLALALATTFAFAMAHSVCQDGDADSEMARANIQSVAQLSSSKMGFAGESTSKPESSKATALDPRLSAMESSLKEAVAAIRSGLGHKTSNASSTDAVIDLISSLRATVIDMLAEIGQQSGDAQKLVQQMVDAFEECQNEWPAREHAKSYEEAVRQHSQCRHNASSLLKEQNTCLDQKKAYKLAMDIACKMYEDAKKDYNVEKPLQGETVENWFKRAADHYSLSLKEFLKIKQDCEDTTKKEYEDLDCGPKMNAFNSQEDTCNKSLIRLEDDTCASVALANEISSDYYTCYSAKVAAYEDRDVELDREQSHKLNWKFAKHLLCIIDSIKDSAVNESAFQLCSKQDDSSTSNLTVQWPATPAQKPITLPTAYPCNEAYEKAVYADLPGDARSPPCTGCKAPLTMAPTPAPATAAPATAAPTPAATNASPTPAPAPAPTLPPTPEPSGPVLRDGDFQSCLTRQGDDYKTLPADIWASGFKNAGPENHFSPRVARDKSQCYLKFSKHEAWIRQKVMGHVHGRLYVLRFRAMISQNYNSHYSGTELHVALNAQHNYRLYSSYRLNWGWWGDYEVTYNASWDLHKDTAYIYFQLRAFNKKKNIFPAYLDNITITPVE